MSKRLKAILFASALVLSLAGVFFFWILSESDSVSVTWQKTLPWVSGACVALFIGLILWFNASRKKL